MRILISIRNPKSEWRKVQDSNPQAACAAVFKTVALPIRLTFRRKNVRREIKEITFFLRFGGNWQARSDLNGGLRFWRPTFCQLKTTRPRYFRFSIFDLQLNKSNRKSQISGVSDGNRTRILRFGRPTLSLSSYAHILIWDLRLRIWDFFSSNPQSQIANPKSILIRCLIQNMVK